MNPELPRRVPVRRGHLRPRPGIAARLRAAASQLRDRQTPRMARFPRGSGLQNTEGECD
jgi:hypothetical protein